MSRSSVLLLTLLVTACDGGTTSDSGADSARDSAAPDTGSADTAVEACMPNEGEADAFIAANSACRTDADCVQAAAGCYSQPQDCCVVYLSATHDTAEWMRIVRAVGVCQGGRCDCCAAIPAAPACNAGTCGPA